MKEARASVTQKKVAAIEKERTALREKERMRAEEERKEEDEKMRIQHKENEREQTRVRGKKIGEEKTTRENRAKKSDQDEENERKQAGNVRQIGNEEKMNANVKDALEDNTQTTQSNRNDENSKENDRNKPTTVCNDEVHDKSVNNASTIKVSDHDKGDRMHSNSAGDSGSQLSVPEQGTACYDEPGALKSHHVEQYLIHGDGYDSVSNSTSIEPNQLLNNDIEKHTDLENPKSISDIPSSPVNFNENAVPSALSSQALNANDNFTTNNVQKVSNPDCGAQSNGDTVITDSLCVQKLSGHRILLFNKPTIESVPTVSTNSEGKVSPHVISEDPHVQACSNEDSETSVTSHTNLSLSSSYPSKTKEQSAEHFLPSELNQVPQDNTLQSKCVNAPTSNLESIEALGIDNKNTGIVNENRSINTELDNGPRDINYVFTVGEKTRTPENVDAVANSEISTQNIHEKDTRNTPQVDSKTEIASNSQGAVIQLSHEQRSLNETDSQQDCDDAQSNSESTGGYFDAVLKRPLPASNEKNVCSLKYDENDNLENMRDEIETDVCDEDLGAKLNQDDRRSVEIQKEHKSDLQDAVDSSNRDMKAEETKSDNVLQDQSSRSSPFSQESYEFDLEKRRQAWSRRVREASRQTQPKSFSVRPKRRRIVRASSASKRLTTFSDAEILEGEAFSDRFANVSVKSLLFLDPISNVPGAYPSADCGNLGEALYADQAKCIVMKNIAGGRNMTCFLQYKNLTHLALQNCGLLSLESLQGCEKLKVNSSLESSFRLYWHQYIGTVIICQYQSEI